MPDTSHQPRDDMRPAAAPDVEAVLGGAEPTGLRRWRRPLWIAAAAGVAIGAYALWFPGNDPAVAYVTEPVARGDLTVIVTAIGSAQPVTQVNVSSELSGTVRRVLVDYNSPVRVGQPLAELDTDKLAATIDSVRAQVDAARARVADATATIAEKRSEYERAQALAQRQVASTRDLDVARAAYERAVAAHASALAEVKVTEAELRLNEINLAKACICSPINGVVLQRSVDPGQTVASSLQTPVLFVIAEDLRRMELQVDVDEADVGAVAVGQDASFTVDAWPERRFPATIRDVRFGSEIVQGVVTYKAVLAIDNSELMIRPGMTATAEIVVETVRDALLVPNAALRFTPASSEPPAQQGGLLERLLPRPPSATFRAAGEGEDGRRTVWVLRDGVPVAIQVAAGATDGRRTEVVGGGLAAGDPVIIDVSAAR